jgi:hypothetical protein
MSRRFFMSTAWGVVERSARRALSAIGLVVVFTVAVAISLAIHVNTIPARRLVAKETNMLVSKVLVGDLRIDRIDSISSNRLVVSRAAMLDRLGKPVLVASGLDVRFGLFALLRGIFEGDDVRVTVPDVRAERVAVYLTRDEEKGGVTFETVFDMAASKPGGSKGKPASVALPRIAVRSASVTTNQSGLEETTATVSNLSAAVNVSPAGVFLSVESDDATIAHAFPGKVRGRLRGDLRLPGTTRATLDGKIEEAPISVVVGWRGPALDVQVRAEALDIRWLDRRAPEALVRADADLSLLLEDDLKLDGAIRISDATLLGYPVPAMEVRGTYAGETLTASATVLDPRLETHVDFRISPDEKIEFRAKSADLNLAALARYGVTANGHASVVARGEVERGFIVGRVDASFRSPSVSNVHAEKAVASGRVEGPLDRPESLAVDFVMDGGRLDVAGARLDHFRATTHGSGRQQAVTLDGSSRGYAAFAASANLSLGDAPILSDVSLIARRGDAAIRATAEYVAFDRGLVIRELDVRSGRGTLSGSIAAREGHNAVELGATNFDLTRALAALGVRAPGVAGRIDAEAHFEETGGIRSGRARVRVRDGAFPPLENLEANLVATFDRSTIEANLEYALVGLASGRLGILSSVRGSVFDPRALRAATGVAELEVDVVDLENTTEHWLTGTGLALRGLARGSVRATKARPEVAPEIAYELDTRDLSISRKTGSGDRTSEIHVEVDSAGDILLATGTRVALNVSDSEGPWIVASLEHSLDAEALARAGEKGWEREILDAPLRGRVTALPRSLELSGTADAAAIAGTLTAVVDVTGTARLPEIEASASVTNRDTAPDDPVRIDAFFAYSAMRERYDLRAHSTGERDRIDLESSGRFGWLDRGLGRDWSARGGVETSRFGVARIGRLLDIPLDGEVSGRCSFDVGAGRLDADADIAVDRLRVDEHAIGSGTGHLRIADDHGEANVQIGTKQSSIDLLGEAGLIRSDGGLELDPRRGGMLRATVRDFDLAWIRRAVSRVATRVTGKLNGRGEIAWGVAGASGERSTTLRANATIADGTFNLVAGGGSFENVKVNALAEGDSPLRIAFSGAARSKAPNVKGSATVRFDGPRLERLDSEIEAKGFPLLVDGILVGRATTGSKAPLEVSITGTGDERTIDVFVPSVDISLPNLSNKSLIALDKDSNVEVVDAAAQAEAKPVATSGTSSITIKVRLGKDVRVDRGALEVPLAGSVTVGRNGRVTGSITLPAGGVVPALGQLFRIRRGVVRFEDQDPGEGTLAIQAWTRVADGTVVDLDVSGTVENPVVGFRSDPPRSEDEIVAVLLGVQSNTVYKPSRNESRQLGNTAMALAMNRLLRDSALSGLQFGAGETGEGDTVSTVSLRVGSKVWIEGRSVRGSRTSVNPSDRVSGVVDWRFAPTWSLRSQLGEVSGVELRWSLRY